MAIHKHEAEHFQNKKDLEEGFSLFPSLYEECEKSLEEKSFYRTPDLSLGVGRVIAPLFREKYEDTQWCIVHLFSSYRSWIEVSSEEKMTFLASRTRPEKPSHRGFIFGLLLFIFVLFLYLFLIYAR